MKLRFSIRASTKESLSDAFKTVNRLAAPHYDGAKHSWDGEYHVDVHTLYDFLYAIHILGGWVNLEELRALKGYLSGSTELLDKFNKFYDAGKGVMNAPPAMQPLNPLVWNIVNKERSRTYYFPDGSTVKIDNVDKLAVSKSGNHRLETADGLKWIVRAGWTHIKIDATHWSL